MIAFDDSAPIEIIYFYAEEDEKHRERIEKHLSPYNFAVYDITCESKRFLREQIKLTK